MANADARPVLDAAVLERLRALTPDGEPDVLTQVLTLFVADAATRLEALNAALDGGDVQALQRGAHALKGAAGSIGALRLQEACRALEETAKPAALDAMPAAVAVVQAEHSRAIAEIRRLTGQLL